MRRKTEKKYIALTIIIPLVLIACIDSLKTARYAVRTEKIGGNVTIALLTDLHDTFYGRDQEILIKKIKKSNPDIILLGGDIYHSAGENLNTRKLLPKLPEIAPTYYVSGNHEIWSGRYGEYREQLVSYGITVLSSDYAELEINGNRIILAGVDDSRLYSIGEDMKRVPDYPDGYKILLAHRPEHINEYLALGFDLILSGHAHGGQVRIPFLLNGVYAPNQGLLPEYAGGVYTFNNNGGNRTMIVSRGLSRKAPPLPRVFNRPELVIINLSR